VLFTNSNSYFSYCYGLETGVIGHYWNTIGVGQHFLDFGETVSNSDLNASHYLYIISEEMVKYLFSMRKYSSYCWKHLPLVLMTDDVMTTSPTPVWYQWPLSERGNSQSRDPELSSAHYITRTHQT